ncbi:hypothetical protein CEUSTIGMA_g12640.t1 [Chlamydomonas eustigma]|uniref:Uncharacterized protein n=1 Tax=Chlamydomonas eustigma TaxID=1157962 RepID=A0A250XQZ1_9CHLO|nr:hypothetical protein CEUSTIGMA_g12640.t1 [Chlamydomonas eustigma]|eukprot:GAX85220.1 hypothetical protein CEUSTIGMA_g12640.t1 [Chlamydomonas eustigma]
MDLPSAMGRQASFLHSLLRPCYLERPFLGAAVDRYLRFLQLHKEHPGLTLVPMMDIDLMWHTHMGVATSYHSDCQALFGRILSQNDDLPPSDLEEGFATTKMLYEQRFPDAGVYNPPPTQLISPNVRHPLESYLGTALLQLYQHPKRRTPVMLLAQEAVAAFSAKFANIGKAALHPTTKDETADDMILPESKTHQKQDGRDEDSSGAGASKPQPAGEVKLHVRPASADSSFQQDSKHQKILTARISVADDPYQPPSPKLTLPTSALTALKRVAGGALAATDVGAMPIIKNKLTPGSLSEQGSKQPAALAKISQQHEIGAKPDVRSGGHAVYLAYKMASEAETVRRYRRGLYEDIPLIGCCFGDTVDKSMPLSQKEHTLVINNLYQSTLERFPMFLGLPLSMDDNYWREGFQIRPRPAFCGVTAALGHNRLRRYPPKSVPLSLNASSI